MDQYYWGANNTIQVRDHPCTSASVLQPLPFRGTACCAGGLSLGPAITLRCSLQTPSLHYTVPQVAGVQYILDTVVQALAANPTRKFSYSEMVRWGEGQSRRGQGHHNGGKVPLGW